MSAQQGDRKGSPLHFEKTHSSYAHQDDGKNHTEQNKKAIVNEMALKVVAAGGLEPPTKGL